MKLAIHCRPGSFSDRWIGYCEKNKISFKQVDCYSPDIISQLNGCDGLMWHWTQGDYRAQNFARQLSASLEKNGMPMFPNLHTCWHFDDKIGQKYLLEAIGAPLVPSYVFYNAKDARKWISETTFPLVFKLRGGAGSTNVKLVRDRRTAEKLIGKSFSRGFPFVNGFSGLHDRFWVLRRDKNAKAVKHLLKGFVRLVWKKSGVHLLPRQKGCIYFQDFIERNSFDDRVVIIGDRAIAIRRHNRKNDFRASGSGLIQHDPKLFDRETIKIAFSTASKIDSQSLAFDFIYNDSGNPLIVEISYAYAQGYAYDNCPGYWDSNLNWHEDDVNPQKYIIEDFVNSLGQYAKKS